MAASMYGLVFASLGSVVQRCVRPTGTGTLDYLLGAYRYRARHCRVGWAGELVVASAGGRQPGDLADAAGAQRTKRKPLLPGEEEEQSSPTMTSDRSLIYDGLRQDLLAS